MICRASCCSRLNPFKSETAEVELIDEYIDDSDLVVLIDVVVQTLR